MVKRHEASHLTGRLFAAYLGALVIGSGFIFLNNMVIHGSTPGELLRFNIPFVLLSDLVIALLLQGITVWRLYPVIRYFRHTGAREDKGPVFHRLIRFPMELFCGMTLVAALFILLYHAAEIRHPGAGGAKARAWTGLAESLLSELSLSLILAILLLTVSRRLLRPLLAALGVTALEGGGRQTSAVLLIGITFAACWVIPLFAGLRFILRPDGTRPFDEASFVLLAGVYSLFSLGIFSLYVFEIRKDLRLLIDRLLGLDRETNRGLRQPVPLCTNDEIGDLADAFNVLHNRVVQTYDEMERQLKLAHDVQQRLLPRNLPLIEGVELAVSCRQCHEVGGDFYDILPLSGSSWAIAVGDVSGKGMPAALLMSAVMAGLRKEAGKGGSPGEILTRLNRSVYTMTKGSIYVTLGLAVWDFSNGTAKLDYASAGHLAPYRIRNGHAAEWPCSSLPLGMAPDSVYQGERTPFQPGDIFAVYTDGVIETRDSNGQMVSFERWEEELGKLTEDPIQRQLPEIWNRIGERSGDELQDDRTVVLLRWKPGSAKV